MDARLVWDTPHAEVWLVDLTRPQAELPLSPAEYARAERMRDADARRRYLAAHSALRWKLASFAELPPEHVAFVLGPYGKPNLVGRPQCHFSLSRRGDLALIGLSREAPLGVDVESAVGPVDCAALAADVCNPREREQLSLAPAAIQAVTFAVCWSRKEACLKAVGTGLSLEPGSVDAGTEWGPRRLSVTTREGDVKLVLASFVVDVNHVGAVATVCRP